MVYKSFDKKSALLADKSASDGAVKTENMSSQRSLDVARVANVSDHTRELA